MLFRSYSESLELRGVEKKVSQKSGNPYLVFHFEEPMGKPMEFVCRDEGVFKPDMKKGDTFSAVFSYEKFGKIDRFNLIGLERVSND